jgi:zinc protease
MMPAICSLPSERRLAALALLVASAAALPAQGAKLDRDKVPAPAPTPVTRIPSWTRVRLANGADLVVSVKKDLPLVAFTLSIVGGATTFETADKVGLANFTAQMLSEGTTTRSADDLSSAQQLLGTSINVAIGNEAGSIGFTALADRFDGALGLLADMMLNPKFPADALERIRGRSLVALQQSRDQPNAIAQNVFARVTYGDAHPYGRVITESTVRAITRDDVAAFHKAYFQPGHTVITVVGDVDPSQVKARVENALSAWAGGGSRPTFDYPLVPAPKARTIYLVDKPKAAQSVFQLGLPGPDRYTSDYFALQVMNTLLGGFFQSRLNHNIREVKGYSYGVNSAFAYGRGPGAFRAGGGIVTAKTDSALIEFMKELNGARGDMPFTDDEIRQGKESLIQSLPETFSSVNGIRSAAAGIYVQALPEDYYQQYAARVNGVTRDDLVRVAKKYIDIEHLNIIIVGDRAVIEQGLRKTGIAPLQQLDVDAKPVVVP